MAKIKVGLIGSGFVAELHMYASKKHGIAQTHRDYCALLADPEIGVVDICTPPALHAKMIVEAMRAGKHVICEKPFAGYFGRPGDPAPIGKHVRKALMYERLMAEMEQTRAAIEASGKLFMYAEDWIYAPAVAKTVEILKATKDKILFMKAEESHSGPHAAHAAQWAMTGGGALIRMGCHPLVAVLYLKQVEARARGETVRAVAVTADVGNVAAGLAPEQRPYIKANPVDVEDWGTLTVTFCDGTKATIFAGDMIMGGVHNLIETYTSGGSLFANITPNNHMLSCMTDEQKLADVYITEKVDRKPAGNSSAWKRNGPAAISRRSKISWNASRPADSRSPVSTSHMTRCRSNMPAIGRPRTANASRLRVDRLRYPIARRKNTAHLTPH
jgi:predicted dehydrogenase